MSCHRPLIGAVLLGGCFSPSLAPGRPCADGADCPPGQTCDVAEGRCALTSGGDGDGGGLADASLPPGARCGTPGSDADDFADGIVRPGWIEYSTQGGQTEVNGALTILVGFANAEGGYLSRHTAELVDTSVYVEVEASADVAHETHFELAHSFFDTGEPPDPLTAKASTDLIGIAVRQGRLVPRIVVNGVETVGPAIPYDMAAHRFWQIVERQGMLSFQTAPAVGEWAEQWSIATPPFAGVVRVRMRARNTTATQTTALSRFLELASAAGPSAWCPAASIADTFNGTTIDPRWFNTGSDGVGCSTTQTNGTVALLQTGGSAADCWYGLSTPSSLTASEVLLTTNPIPAGGSSSHHVYLLADDARGGFLLLRYESGANQICARWAADGQTGGQCITYLSTYRYWRIRESGGSLRWGVSADGTSFDEFHVASPAVLVDELEFFFGSSTNGPSFPSGSAAITGYNAPE